METAEQLRELGEKLGSELPASADAVAKLLEQAAEGLHVIEQSPGSSVMRTIQPCLNAVAREELLKHQDEDVKVLLATCFCEITRITAPEAPYSDDVLRTIFHLIVGTFSGLIDVHSHSYVRRVAILETVARYRACVVMLDLECNDLITDMFRTFLQIASDNHDANIAKSMQTIMAHIIDESEDIHESLLHVLLSALGRRKTGISFSARKLARSVIEHSAGKLEPYIKKFLTSSLAGDNSSSNGHIDHHEVIFDVYQCAPKVLKVVVPYITGELLADQAEMRSKSVDFLGELFSLPGVPILESFKPLFIEFLKRLTDRVVEIRVSMIEHLKECLLSNHSRPEAPEITKALCDRLLDYEENVRKQVVAALCDVACHSFGAVPVETIKLVADRVRDKSISVKCYTMERLADIYRLYCLKGSDSSTNSSDFEWIPGKILRCLYDKDFRPESIESILSGSLFPPEFPTKERVQHWVTAVAHFDKVEMKALEQILLQKQRFDKSFNLIIALPFLFFSFHSRNVLIFCMAINFRLQQEMLKYIGLRETRQEDAPDVQKRIVACFRSMSRLFSDATKAEENLNMLHQLNDANIWKIFTSLLDCSTTFNKAWSIRVDLLKKLGEEHALHDFVSTLSMRCSYLLVNKEYAKEILSEASEQKSAGNSKLISSCMNLLTAISSFFPSLLSGLEEDIIELLKEDNELLKEGIAHVLSKAGGNIREQLASSSSVALLLERLCLEGTRRQAKYSVHALAAITKDDGLMALSVLYKRLVDLLEEKKVHLPSILQSLGCIAQIAMPIFETRGEEIINFITKKILECSDDMVEVSADKSEWGDSSYSCLLKIYGIKTLVKSCLPCKDAQADSGLEKLMGILKNILTYGDISPDMISSASDKAHLRLAAAKSVLRLSRQWDHKVPVDVFYLTLRISQDDFPQMRKLFLSKVHQYIKERVLDAKYACAFLLGVDDYRAPQYEEFKHNLIEVAQICQQVKMRQLSVQADVNSLTAYPEYIISYLVHVLAHDPSCPTVEEYEDVNAFGPIYWRLHLLLSTLLGEEGSQYSVPGMKKESFMTTISIFRSIKCSEDVVDVNKTKTLHAICDLGILIAKRLCQDEINISENQTVPLPAQLYVPVKDQDESSVEGDGKMWLGCENVLTHFEALMTANTAEVESPEGKMLIDETDEFGNEIPLGKIVQILKSRGAKKAGRKQNAASSSVNAGKDDDVLGLVREINLDNEENSGELVKSKTNKQQMDTKESTEKSVDFSTPKRKRSVSKSRPHPAKDNDEILVNSVNTEKTNNSLESKLKKEKSRAESTETDLIASPASTKTPASKGKKSAKKSHAEVLHSSAKSADESTMGAAELGSQNGSFRRQKPRLASGLAKCSTVDSSSTDLVGHKIKVWWPLDKKFYEGFVKSYNSAKKLHTVLYDDGEVEELNMTKEKWRMIESNGSPMKQKKDHPGTIQGRAHDMRTTSSRKAPPNQHKSAKRPSPLTTRGKPKGLPESKRRKTAGGNKAVEVSNAGSDSSSSLAHSDHDEDVKSDGHKEKEVAVSSAQKKRTVKESKVELKEEKPDGNSLSSKEESDDETLSVWKKRTSQAT
ncbi:sister chromatid cohesion protein PDS5 homolog A isoform X2 [Brachypodium distachyon]|uniref:sister chromatid cohesion protein PDS5 homolog A isoform X2 n=1 Tax=Brachypodium distachyon TaxID=15368 RepID=UPI00052FF5A9|nr:sister chromatid cohesion protein PDS5 homolog A isoform X2 [Brachypodium distachyon]|eukprot:XP_010227757.1 sister chromatid cohesion protein PDS5 homolog A isoform X2 [Brachypodium distachyon]